MSDFWIAVVPRDPWLVPENRQIGAALTYFESIAPESDNVTFTTNAGVEFRDCGENLAQIICPVCREKIATVWWQDQMSGDYGENGFRLAPFRLPCCGGESNLNGLIYDWDQGFSRFILEAMNPNLGTLQPDQVQRMVDILGTDLKVIYQHI